MNQCEVCGRTRNTEYLRAVPGGWRCRARSSCKMYRKDARNRLRKQARLQAKEQDR